MLESEALIENDIAQLGERKYDAVGHHKVGNV